MPPKKKAAPAPANKGKATAKTTGKGKGRSKAKSPSVEPDFPVPEVFNPLNQRTKWPQPKPNEPVPDWDQNIRSKSARDKKRVKISRKSQLGVEIDVEHIEQEAARLTGASLNSWGQTHKQPIEGLSRKRARRVVISSFADVEAELANMMDSLGQSQRQIIENSPTRSPILRLSLEIREQIYSYLLVYPKPVMVKYDWQAVERNPFQDRSIMFVCKLFATEASSFLYKANTFQAVVRKPPFQFRRFEDPPSIEFKYLSNYRNIVLDCTKECWDICWYEKITQGIEKLVEANAAISSLTLLLIPQSVGMSTTALGMEYNPIAFADFLWYPGELMSAIRKLSPTVFNIIVKKEGRKRFLMTIDMTYLHLVSEEGGLANEETLRVSNGNSILVKEELMGLKDRFEEIFEDDEEAVAEGKCAILGKNDILGDLGFSPATGKSDSIATFPAFVKN